MSWTLFVDESGDLDLGGERGVVAGLLLPAGLHAPLQRDLRSRLETVFAGVPWPPHASTLNIPVATAVAAARVPSRQRPAEVDALRRELAPMLGGVALEDWSGLHALDARVAEERPDAWRRLKALRTARHEGVRQVMTELSRLTGPQGALALFATEATDSDQDERPARSMIVRDPYVRLLRLLLEQVHALLWHQGRGVEVVEAVVADRHVSLVEGNQRVPLVPRFVGEVAREASRVPLLGDGDPRRGSVAVVATGRQPYRGEALPAGLVLADWLANQGARALRRDRGLLALGQSLDAVALAGLPLERSPGLAPGAAPLPTLAWGGEARERVHRAAREGRVTPTEDLAPPRWVPEVTAPWVEAAAGGTWR